MKNERYSVKAGDWIRLPDDYKEIPRIAICIDTTRNPTYRHTDEFHYGSTVDDNIRVFCPQDVMSDNRFWQKACIHDIQDELTSPVDPSEFLTQDQMDACEEFLARYQKEASAYTEKKQAYHDAKPDGGKFPESFSMENMEPLLSRACLLAPLDVQKAFEKSSLGSEMKRYGKIHAAKLYHGAIELKQDVKVPDFFNRKPSLWFPLQLPEGEHFHTCYTGREKDAKNPITYHMSAVLHPDPKALKNQKALSRFIDSYSTVKDRISDAQMGR